MDSRAYLYYSATFVLRLEDLEKLVLLRFSTNKATRSGDALRICHTRQPLAATGAILPPQLEIKYPLNTQAILTCCLTAESDNIFEDCLEF